MSTTTTTVENVIVPVEIPPTEELTAAIVSAAKPKTVRKYNKKVQLPSIVEEIIENLQTGKYTQEALVELARVFGREFVPDEEPAPVKKGRKPKEAGAEKKPKNRETDPAASSEEAPVEKKTKKVTKKKVDEVPSEEAPVEKKTKKVAKKVETEPAEEAPSTPVEKKTKKVTKKVETEPAEEAPSTPVEKKTKKATKKVETEPAEEAPSTPVEKKAKKVTKKVETESAEEAPSTPVEKKTKKVTKKVETEPAEEAHSTPVEKKVKKVTKKVTIDSVVEETTNIPVARPATPLLPEEPEEQLPNLETRLEGFSADDELEEEELSDIENDE